MFLQVDYGRNFSLHEGGPDNQWIGQGQLKNTDGSEAFAGSIASITIIRGQNCEEALSRIGIIKDDLTNHACVNPNTDGKSGSMRGMCIVKGGRSEKILFQDPAATYELLVPQQVSCAAMQSSTKSDDPYAIFMRSLFTEATIEMISEGEVGTFILSEMELPLNGRWMQFFALNGAMVMESQDHGIGMTAIPACRAVDDIPSNNGALWFQVLVDADVKYSKLRNARGKSCWKTEPALIKQFSTMRIVNAKGQFLNHRLTPNGHHEFFFHNAQYGTWHSQVRVLGFIFSPNDDAYQIPGASIENLVYAIVGEMPEPNEQPYEGHIPCSASYYGPKANAPSLGPTTCNHYKTAQCEESSTDNEYKRRKVATHCHICEAALKLTRDKCAHCPKSEMAHHHWCCDRFAQKICPSRQLLTRKDFAAPCTLFRISFYDDASGARNTQYHTEIFTKTGSSPQAVTMQNLLTSQFPTAEVNSLRNSYALTALRPVVSEEYGIEQALAIILEFRQLISQARIPTPGDQDVSRDYFLPAADAEKLITVTRTLHLVNTNVTNPGPLLTDHDNIALWLSFMRSIVSIIPRSAPPASAPVQPSGEWRPVYAAAPIATPSDAEDSDYVMLPGLIEVALQLIRQYDTRP